MVDVSAKPVTVREARAEGYVRCTQAVLDLLADGGLPKGDALAVARIAGLQAAKRTPDLVPLAHPVAVHAVEVDIVPVSTPGLTGVHITAAVRTADRTGIEMEALTCVAVAGLTFVDMVKASTSGPSWTVSASRPRAAAAGGLDRRWLSAHPGGPPSS